MKRTTISLFLRFLMTSAVASALGPNVVTVMSKDLTDIPGKEVDDYRGILPSGREPITIRRGRALKIHPISRSLLALPIQHSAPRPLTRLPVGMAQKPVGKIEILRDGRLRVADPGGFAGHLCSPSTGVIAEAGPRGGDCFRAAYPSRPGLYGDPYPIWTIPPHADLTPKGC